MVLPSWKNDKFDKIIYDFLRCFDNVYYEFFMWKLYTKDKNLFQNLRYVKQPYEVFEFGIPDQLNEKRYQNAGE